MGEATPKAEGAGDPNPPDRNVGALEMKYIELLEKRISLLEAKIKEAEKVGCTRPSTNLIAFGLISLQDEKKDDKDDKVQHIMSFTAYRAVRRKNL